MAVIKACQSYELSFLVINAATNASNTLKGTAILKILRGSTLMFQITIHIKTKPTNQPRKTVCSRVNFLAMINKAVANSKDQTPHMAPLTGSEGNVNPRD